MSFFFLHPPFLPFPPPPPRPTHTRVRTGPTQERRVTCSRLCPPTPALPIASLPLFRSRACVQTTLLQRQEPEPGEGRKIICFSSSPRSIASVIAGYVFTLRNIAVQLLEAISAGSYRQRYDILRLSTSPPHIFCSGAQLSPWGSQEQYESKFC